MFTATLLWWTDLVAVIGQSDSRGTDVRGLMRNMATLPQGNQEPFMVKDKVGRPPGELGVSKSLECDIGCITESITAERSLQCFDTVGWASGRASDL